VAECDKLPLFPVIVSVRVPLVVLEVVEIVSVDVVLVPVMEVGLNDPVVRDGKLVTLRLTLPVNPFCLTMVTV
jgi:hypothetical protein